MPSSGNSATGNLWRPGAVATMQYPVSHVIGQVVLETLRLFPQELIEKDDIGGVIKRADQRVQRALGIPLVLE